MNTPIMADLLQLTVAERIHLVDDIWDSIAAEAIEDPGRLPVPEAQLNEIRRRWETYLQNPDDVVPFDDALERIERSLE
jgi:putative addiction module component (TIGR02574 family)